MFEEDAETHCSRAVPPRSRHCHFLLYITVVSAVHPPPAQQSKRGDARHARKLKWVLSSTRRFGALVIECPFLSNHHGHNTTVNRGVNPTFSILLPRTACSKSMIPIGPSQGWHRRGAMGPLALWKLFEAGCATASPPCASSTLRDKAC